MCRVQIKYIRYGRDDRINQIRETGNIKYIENPDRALWKGI